MLNLSSNGISVVFSFHLVGDLIDSDGTLRIELDDAKDDEAKELER